ncbi:uncharacterized protein LOC112686880 [Sipha flava]|uniref:Uncharacterized protein LOC112686880 n=1 Tax=Sipha flava TaxID=143950 RepID=A0A8B8FXQ3_9HEMI|nr:uncharacterized protein LOC112686880 [Sipha flava]XP_025415128.1 uncharacterized protein LOC112686880 [Sipha flava]XP_025415129.1 uncharacterized protein LOC112686880 [Sipha flava]XP_025415130.1 uncharacterized protein LOC112686880 [Sipha flava]XP_025415131.1 uncharacterized protein LOC112686880 [Sipha flava]
MPINGNALAKYLVMMSQVIAWFTVSVMLLRRGLNQVNADGQQQPSMYKSEMGMIVNDTTVKPDIGHHNHQGTAAKPFDESGTHAVVAGVIMITIAVIMLIISPTIMLMKMVDKRNHRVLDIELESPPKYEDVVESAPRYSSLFIFNNDGEMALLPENTQRQG